MFQRISVYLAIVFLSACAPAVQVLKNDIVDNNNKTVFVPGNGKFYSHIRRDLKKKGWKVTTQYGYNSSKGVVKDGEINVNQGVNYSTKYTLECAIGTYWDFGTRYVADCTLLDNIKGIDVVNISIERTELEIYSLEEAVEKVISSL